MKIKNKYYREFLDSGLITELNEEIIQEALKNVQGFRGKFKDEGRALLILLYYTGCRPIEALRVKAKDIERDGHYVKVRLKGAKGGLPRTLYLKRSKPMVKELLDFAERNYDEMVIFWHYIGTYKRKVKTKKGDIKERIDKTDKLRYHFRVWFKDVLEKDDAIPPYFLRHNRFSKLAEKGVRMEDIRLVKGSKTFDSVTPYLHMSKERARKISSKLD